MTADQIREALTAAADTSYRDFSASLTPCCGKMLGVRIPTLRKLAQQIASGNWREWVALHPTDTFEELTLWGLVVGYARTSNAEHYALTADFVPHINNWATCDVCCSTLKFIAKSRTEGWLLVKHYLHSDAEFEVRFAAVCLLDYFITDDYIDATLAAIGTIRHEGYYAQMAVAWALSVCYVKFPAQTFDFLQTAKLPKFTLQRTVSKICDSYRVAPDSKKSIKLLAAQQAH